MYICTKKGLRGSSFMPSKVEPYVVDAYWVELPESGRVKSLCRPYQWFRAGSLSGMAENSDDVVVEKRG